MSTVTRYGKVNSAVLEELRESFDTRRILDAVDKIDDIRCRIDDIRDELLKLHGMAHDLINDAGPDGPPPEYPIWELADEISMTIWEWPKYLDMVRHTVDQIATLLPEPDEEFENK
jgi:hypothetical protein